MSQLDLLANTCKQLTVTISTMRNEIGTKAKKKINKSIFILYMFLDTLKSNQEALCARNDLLLVREK